MKTLKCFFTSIDEKKSVLKECEFGFILIFITETQMGGGDRGKERRLQGGIGLSAQILVHLTSCATLPAPIFSSLAS